MTEYTKEQILDAEALREELVALQINVRSLEEERREIYSELSRSEKATFTRKLNAAKKKVAVLQNYLNDGPPEPLHPETAIDHVLRSLRREIEKYEASKVDFLTQVEKDPTYAIQWAEGIVRGQYSARSASQIIDGIEKYEGSKIEEWGSLIARLDYLQTRLQKEQLNFYGMNSTSAFSNAVDLAQGRARASMLRMGWLEYAKMTATSLQDRVDIWAVLQE